MTEDRTIRRLAAILSADVAGYSRLMEADETGTLTVFKRHRSELIDLKIKQYGGRIVGTAGDGMLCEFSSVVDAVQCAVEIQTAMPARNADSPEDRHMLLRVGVNLGDVIVDGEDIHGDGVNVAARLETIAEPGTVYVSGPVYDQAAGKLPYAFEDKGEHNVKNISRPIHVWRVIPITSKVRRDRESDGPSLPDKPSIAVLPFTNMSGDPEQEYFSDGLTEDIITELARFGNLFVIARNSVFTYKGQAVDIPSVARKLGVRYVAEGSVRRAGKRIRVTVQLIDGLSGNHIWAERYDRDLEDIFAVQDEITATIVGSVWGQIDVASQERATRLNSADVTVYDLMLQGRALWFRCTPQDNEQARLVLERAIALDPDNASALSLLAWVHVNFWLHNWVPGDAWSSELEQALSFATRAVASNDRNAQVVAILAETLLYCRRFDESAAHFRKAIALNPNDTEVRSLYGFFLSAIGQPDEAMREFSEIQRRSPIDTSLVPWLKGCALFVVRQYEAAIENLHRVREPINEAHRLLAASYAYLGQAEAAQREVQWFLDQAERNMRAFPGKRLGDWRNYLYAVTAYQRDEDFEHLMEGLRRAGMPD